MIYKVRILRRARNDIRTIASSIADQTKTGATAWAGALDLLLVKLAAQPDSFPIAEEDEEFDIVIRQATFKTKRGLRYRTVFTMVSDEVRILRVRGPGQDSLSPNDI